MYRITIHGCTDEFAEAVHGKEFNRRGLIRFLFRHAYKLFDYETLVTVSRDYGPGCPVNYFLIGRDMSDLVGKMHMSDRIPVNRVSRRQIRKIRK